jgi:iron complex transport system substrate-binding protein
VLVGGLDTHGLDAAGIDALVRSRIAAGEMLYTLDVDRFRRVDPEVVLTQDLCRVCALSGSDVDAAIRHLGCSASVVTLDPHTLDEVFGTILAVGDACGAAAQAEALVGELRERVAAVRAAVNGRPRRRVFVLEWPDPPFVAGHWVPELVDIAGGEAVLAKPGGRSVTTSWEEIEAAQPDVVIVASCGFDLAGAVQHARELDSRLPSNAEVWCIDANGLVVRPGPRLVDGIETIAALLHGVGALNPTQVVRFR